MKRLLPLLLLLLAVAAGAWLMFSDPKQPAAPEEPDEPPAVEVSDPEAAAAATPPPAAAAEAGLPADAAEGTRGRIETAEAGLAGPSPFEASFEGDQAVLVRVLLPDGETPAAGAVVFHVDEREVDEREAMQALQELGDITAVLERVGQRYRADAGGEVRVPLASAHLVLGARTDDAFHFQIFPDLEAGEEVVIELQPRSKLEAQVFGTSGRPVAGVPVALMVRAGSMARTMLTVETKGKDGIATIRDFAPLIQIGPLAAAAAEVALALPLAEPVAERIHLDDLPEEPYLLELPPTGEVIVEVYDVDGERIQLETSVTLAEAVEEPERGFGGFRSGPSAGASQGVAELVKGEARFPWVGLGMMLQASVQLPDYPKPITAVAPGPAAEGRVVRLRLQPDTAASVLAGRVVDERGEPIRSTELNLIYEVESGGSNSTNWSSLETDEQGRFRYPLEEPVMRQEGSRSLQLNLPGENWGEALARLELDLATAYPPGVTELGDLMLTELPLLAAGQVIGPSGEPVAEADIMLQWKHYYGDDDWYWNHDWRVRTTCDAEGRFELRGRPSDEDAEELQVQASADGYREAGAPFYPGETGLLIQLGAGGSLAGRVLADEGLDLDELQVSFVREAEGGGTNSHGAGVDEDGSFRWSSLEPGPGRVEVVPNNEEEPVFVADGIVIAPGENADPRLDPIDLRGLLKSIKLEFVDEDGDPVQQVMINSLAEDSHLWIHSWNGEKTILTAEDSLDLLVSSAGYQSVELRGLRQDTEVVLRPSAELLFVLAEPPAMKEGVELTVALRRTGGRGWWSGESTGRFNEFGEARLHAPGSGEFIVMIGLMRVEGNSTTTTMLHEASSPNSVTIQDASVSQTYTLRVDQEKLRQRMDSF